MKDKAETEAPDLVDLELELENDVVAMLREMADQRGCSVNDIIVAALVAEIEEVARQQGGIPDPAPCAEAMTRAGTVPLE